MPDTKQRASGRVVYSRLGGMGDGAQPPREKLEKRESASPADMQESLWRALVPLLVGFALLIGLVFGLGVLSVNKLKSLNSASQAQERRLLETSNRLLSLRLAVNRLNTEARIRAQVESGTSGGLQPPVDLRLRNERDAVEKLLPLYDALTLRRPEKKQAVRRDIESFIEITKDLREYSLRGFPAFRDLDGQLTDLFADVNEERTIVSDQRYEALEKAQAEIDFLKWLAALTGLVVGAATTLEVFRRFRQMRRSFDELRRERQFSTQMLEGMVSAIAAIDRDDRIRSANAAFFEVFPQAKPGMSIHDDFASAEGMKMLTSVTSKHAHAAAYHGRWRLNEGADGEGPERSFDVYSSPLEIDGEPGELLTLVDATEAARAEQELRHQESLAAVGQAAAQVAHEIKNPLGSIRLGVAMLRDMTQDREAVTTIDLVERGIDHLSKLTLDVTQFSRGRKLSLSDVDLHELLDAGLSLVSDKIQEKDIRIERHLSAQPLEGRWDEDQLRQVFVNLFANAIDAGPQRAPVRFSTERVTLNTDNRRNGEGGGAPKPFARIVISDEGIGMDEATRARIFEPFFTTKKRGTGLGLAIAKQIIEQHGGRIGVASKPGEGTSFTVDLPL